MTTTRTKQWTVTIVVQERDDCEPFGDPDKVADFVTWKVRDGVILDVITAKAMEKRD